MTGIAVTVAVVYGFMQLTQALWIHPPGALPPSAAQLALIAAQHHDVTLLAMLLGGLIALLGTLAVTDAHPRGQALTMALMPIPLLVTMALSIQLATHRSPGIAVLAVVVGVGTYLRKFAPRLGSRVVLYGILLFVGYLFGFVGGGAIKERDLGWIAVIAWLAVLVNLLLKVVYRPLDRGRLARTSRAFRARACTVIAAAADLFDAEAPRARASRRLHRRLRGLTTALVIDASLAASGALRLGCRRGTRIVGCLRSSARSTTSHTSQSGWRRQSSRHRRGRRSANGSTTCGRLGEIALARVRSCRRPERALALAGVAERDVPAIISWPMRSPTRSRPSPPRRHATAPGRTPTRFRSSRR